MNLEILNAQARSALPSPLGRRAGHEGAQLAIDDFFPRLWERTEVRVRPLPAPLPTGEVRVRVRRFASNMAEILEA